MYVLILYLFACYSITFSMFQILHKRHDLVIVNGESFVEFVCTRMGFVSCIFAYELDVAISILFLLFPFFFRTATIAIYSL